MSSSLKERAHEVLEVAAPGDSTSRIVDSFITALILVNVVVVMLETVPGLLDAYAPVLLAFELLTVAVFTVEYLARLWSVTLEPRYSRPVLGRLKWALTPLALVDLLAILPFYLPLIRVDLRFLRILRLLRFARILKIGRYSDALRTLGRVMQAKRAELISTVVVAVMLLVVTASLTYLAEREAQPERYSSIPAAMWWSVATMTGNAQALPVTLAGRLLGAVTALLGVGLFALPAGILASGFSSELQTADADRAEEGDEETRL